MWRFCETISGLFELFRLGWISRFRLKGPYWQWRMHTAFGRGRPSNSEMVAGVLEYGRWIRRMRRAAGSSSRPRPMADKLA